MYTRIILHAGNNTCLNISNLPQPISYSTIFLVFIWKPVSKLVCTSSICNLSSIVHQRFKLLYKCFMCVDFSLRISLLKYNLGPLKLAKNWYTNYESACNTSQSSYLPDVEAKSVIWVKMCQNYSLYRLTWSSQSKLILKNLLYFSGHFVCFQCVNQDTSILT